MKLFIVNHRFDLFKNDIMADMTYVQAALKHCCQMLTCPRLLASSSSMHMGEGELRMSECYML